MSDYWCKHDRPLLLRRPRFVPALLLLLAAVPVQATEYGNFAIKAGLLHHDDPAYDEAANLGLTVGGRIFNGEYYSLGLQFEMTTSVIEGNTDTARKDWEMDSHAIYAGLRVGQDHFFKIKAGYIDWQVRYDNAPDINDSGFSWGVSYGYPLRKGRALELEYTVMSDRPDFGISYISLGYYF